MSFTPFARYRNFTLANLKALLEVYPDMARSIPWEEAKDFAEANLKGYKRTAYQQACQLGLEDRTKDSFRIHNYLYCLLYTSPSPRDGLLSRMPSSA